MKRFAFAVCALVLVACAKRDDQTAADTAGATAAAATPATPAPIKASDISGNWTVTAKNTANDSTLLTYDLAVPNDTSFTITFANGQKVSGRVVSIAGDSIVLETGAFPSVLRKGVQVRTMSTVRLQDGRLVGTTTSRYATKRADSVLVIRTEGTRKP